MQAFALPNYEMFEVDLPIIASPALMRLAVSPMNSLNAEPSAKRLPRRELATRDRRARTQIATQEKTIMSLGVLSNVAATYAENNPQQHAGQPADGAPAALLRFAYQQRLG